MIDPEIFPNMQAGPSLDGHAFRVFVPMCDLHAVLFSKRQPALDAICQQLTDMADQMREEGGRAGVARYHTPDGDTYELLTWCMPGGPPWPYRTDSETADASNA